MTNDFGTLAANFPLCDRRSRTSTKTMGCHRHSQVRPSESLAGGERCRSIGNALGNPCVASLRGSSQNRVLWIVENTEELEQHTSLCKLGEWVPICGMDGMQRQEEVALYRFGAAHERRTDLRSSVQIGGCPWERDHDLQWWRKPPDGRWSRARHPPLRGRHRAITHAEWQASSSSNNLGFVTKAVAAYSLELNRQVASALLLPAGQRGRIQWSGGVGQQACQKALGRVGERRATLDPPSRKTVHTVWWEGTVCTALGCDWPGILQNWPKFDQSWPEISRVRPALVRNRPEISQMWPEIGKHWPKLARTWQNWPGIDQHCLDVAQIWHDRENAQMHV